MKNTSIDLTRGPVLKVIALFALPILISNIFQQLYNTADTMIVGNYLGEEALAAVGATAAIFELIVGFALGVGNGMSIVIARYYGARNEDMVKRSVAATLVIGLGLSLLVMLVGHFGLLPLLGLLGTPANIINQSYAYISVIMSFVIVTFSYNLGAGLLRAIGNSLMSLVVLVFASILNIVLDITFITRLHLGVAGAGIATIIAQALSALLCFIYIYKKCPILIPRHQHFKLDMALYGDLLGQGLSMGFMSSIVSIGTVILQMAINGLGVSMIAAQTTARRIQSFAIMPLTALASGVATFTSQNYGAMKYHRIHEGIKKASRLAISWGIMAVLLLHFLSPALTQLISGSSKAELLNASTRYLSWNTPFYPILGCLFILRNTLQGLGKKVTPLVSSVIELLGKILFVIFLIPSMGYFGVIICEPLIWLFMTVQLYYAYREQPFIKQEIAYEKEKHVQ
ncbi:MATE family efflux transporter [Streptococcus orisratti]|uniref:MATE family efflux transporter n=1 Tax=Streptococcus orisratti TaxID=114652 RepID=UPI003D01AC47